MLMLSVAVAQVHLHYFLSHQIIHIITYIITCFQNITITVVFTLTLIFLNQID